MAVGTALQSHTHRKSCFKCSSKNMPTFLHRLAWIKLVEILQYKNGNSIIHTDFKDRSIGNNLNNWQQCPKYRRKENWPTHKKERDNVCLYSSLNMIRGQDMIRGLINLIKQARWLPGLDSNRTVFPSNKLNNFYIQKNSS